ncbi:MAG TPA: hypothetical protein VEC93_00845, partial [Anaerolineae bacterium]|nr:hypothetical protein [Anaerolineae bacterium]
HMAGQPQVWIAITFDSDSSVTFQGPFIDAISLRKNTQAAREFITQENFDVDPFPNASWVSFDDNGSSFIWDDVACFSRSGSWSMWAGAIDWPVTGPNPCPGSLNNYPVNTELWLMYGPFSLNAANEAWVDFYFRNESEAGFDFLFWGASTNSTDFFGSQLSGTYIQGPHGNGYNFIRFDLKSVPTLGDLRGRNAVWFAFVFASDNIITSRGAFIDDVNIVVERNKTFLPVVQRPVPPPPSGTLTFENHTGNPIIVQLINYGIQTFPSNVGPHVWSGIPPGNYEWLASGTCPGVGQGQVGSVPPPDNRAPITIVANQTTILNQERNGRFSCN